MPGPPIRRRLAAWTAGLAVLGVVAVATATPAAAAPTPPPWVNGALQPAQWIAYQLSPLSLTALRSSPGQWGPVMLTRLGNAPLTVLQSEPTAGGQPGWPSNWNSGGWSLSRIQPCDLTASSCQYNITSGGGTFSFAATGGATDVSQYSQTPQLNPAPPPLNADLTNIPASGTSSSGPFSFAAVVADQVPGAHNFRWTLTSPSGTIDTREGQDLTSYQPPSSVFSQNGQYCVALVVTASDGTSATKGPACFAVTVSNTTPAPPAGGGGVGGTPTPPPASGGGGPLPAAPSPPPAAPLSFAKPLPNFAVPVPGAVQQVTVIWLWKPDWFQATASKLGKSPKTAGTPNAVKRASVSVSRTAHNSSPSATPWLASLGAFGILGAGWLAFRRRQIRSSLLD